MVGNVKYIIVVKVKISLAMVKKFQVKRAGKNDFVNHEQRHIVDDLKTFDFLEWQNTNKFKNRFGCLQRVYRLGAPHIYMLAVEMVTEMQTDWGDFLRWVIDFRAIYIMRLLFGKVPSRNDYN